MPRPKTGQKVRAVRFTDAEWAELQAGAQAMGEARSEAIRAGAMSRVRQAIPDASDVIQAQPWAGIVSAGALPKPARPPDAAWEDVARDYHNGLGIGGHYPPEVPYNESAAQLAARLGFDPLSAVEAKRNKSRETRSVAHVFACAYCPAEFATEFDAEAHVDNLHSEKDAP